MKLNVKGFALTAGLSILLITLISLWHGGGGHLALLKLIFPSYEVTYLGSADILRPPSGVPRL